MKTTLHRISRTGQVAAFSVVIAIGCSRNEAEIMPIATQEAPPPLPTQATIEQGIAALVNGHQITVDEVRAIFEERIAPYRNQIPEDQIETFWQAQMPGMLEMAVARQLIRSAIEQGNIQVTDTDIDAKLEEFQQHIPPGNTIEELTGRTIAEIRQDVGEMLKFEKLMERYDLAAIEPTESELQTYYDDHQDDFQIQETVQARHILISVDEEEDDDTRAAKREQIDALRQQLVDGADFAEIAAAHSDCPSGSQGGNLGSFGRGQMVSAFENAAFDQEINAIGPVIETQFGYHIVQVLSSEAARQVPLSEAREHISARLMDETRQKNQEQLIRKLRGDAEINYYLP